MAKKRILPKANKRPASGPSRSGPDASGNEIVFALFAQIEDLNRRAVQEYAPVVEAILRSGSRDLRQIEHTLDCLFDFCGYGPVLALYRRLCRHYWDIDPAAAASYVRLYRGMWDSGAASE